MTEPVKPLFMFFPEQQFGTRPNLELPEGYFLRTYQEEDRAAYLQLLASEGWPQTDENFANFLDLALPQGIFFIIEEASGEIVATASALHNPKSGHMHFPFGGEIGYVITTPEHRGRGLGSAVTLVVVNRLIRAEYTSIRLGTHDDRLPALAVYLKLGFEPLIYCDGMEERWAEIYEQLGK